ncbi:MAG: hypothetical protein COC06_09680 [Bacteroidales bacterium]|nr:MAG: hypothetical protein COC06_09680 [Bacteroidales bacterium]
MKKILFLSLVAVLSLAACNSKAKQEKQTKEEKIEAISISEVMKMAEENIGKEICFQGIVNHVCAHSGRRCILIDSTGKLSLRVEAKGEINGFNRELSGSTIVVKGTLQEKRLSEEFISEWEAKVKAKEDAEEGGEHCASEMTNIKQMREWMKTKNKDFYSIYFVNGTSYEIVD